MKMTILLLILTSNPAFAAESCPSKTKICNAVHEYNASHEASLFARVTVKLEILNQVQDLSTGN